jgi:hypothetical protein
MNPADEGQVDVSGRGDPPGMIRDFIGVYGQNNDFVIRPQNILREPTRHGRIAGVWFTSGVGVSACPAPGVGRRPVIQAIKPNVPSAISLIGFRMVPPAFR